MRGVHAERRVPAAVQRADFIVTTGDSSYWVTSGPQGLRMRGVPMLLARVDGRFREIYVADDDRSYFDAVLVGRSASGRATSSAAIRSELFADTLVPALRRVRTPRRIPTTRRSARTTKPPTTRA